jgi:hypothetical protein
MSTGLGRQALSNLTQWCSIEFAARCARRIEWLFSLAHPGASPTDLIVINTAITYAQQAAAQRNPKPSGFTFKDTTAPLQIVTSLGCSVDQIFSPNRQKVLQAISPPAVLTAVCVALVANGAASVSQAAWDTAAHCGLEVTIDESIMALDAALAASLLTKTQRQALATVMQTDLQSLTSRCT